MRSATVLLATLIGVIGVAAIFGPLAAGVVFAVGLIYGLARLGAAKRTETPRGAEQGRQPIPH